MQNQNNDLNAYRMQIRFENKSNNPDPDYAHEGDSGFDLRAFLPEPIVLYPFKRILVPTGLFFELKNGFEIQIRSRSGLTLKNGVIVLNEPGTLDSAYRGELGVILANLGEEPFTINNGDRIAQGIVAGVINKMVLDLVRVDEIDKDTERGAGGFGSTKIQ